METMTPVENLECWQASHELVEQVHKLIRNGRSSKDFTFKSKFSRSAVSAMANIAEGFHRSSESDFMRLLEGSRSSIVETIRHAHAALDQGYIDEVEMIQLQQQADIAWKHINRLLSF